MARYTGNNKCLLHINGDKSPYNSYRASMLPTGFNISWWSWYDKRARNDLYYHVTILTYHNKEMINALKLLILLVTKDKIGIVNVKIEYSLFFNQDSTMRIDIWNYQYIRDHICIHVYIYTLTRKYKE